MKKRYCDWCGKEVNFDAPRVISTCISDPSRVPGFSENRDEEVYDTCFDCMHAFRKAMQNLKSK